MIFDVLKEKNTSEAELSESQKYEQLEHIFDDLLKRRLNFTQALEQVFNLYEKPNYEAARRIMMSAYHSLTLSTRLIYPNGVPENLLKKGMQRLGKFSMRVLSIEQVRKLMMWSGKHGEEILGNLNQVLKNSLDFESRRIERSRLALERMAKLAEHGEELIEQIFRFWFKEVSRPFVMNRRPCEFDPTIERFELQQRIGDKHLASEFGSFVVDKKLDVAKLTQEAKARFDNGDPNLIYALLIKNQLQNLVIDRQKDEDGHRGKAYEAIEPNEQYSVVIWRGDEYKKIYIPHDVIKKNANNRSDFVHYLNTSIEMNNESGWQKWPAHLNKDDAYTKVITMQERGKYRLDPDRPDVADMSLILSDPTQMDADLCQADYRNFTHGNGINVALRVAMGPDGMQLVTKNGHSMTDGNPARRFLGHVAQKTWDEFHAYANAFQPLVADHNARYYPGREPKSLKVDAQNLASLYETARKYEKPTTSFTVPLEANKLNQISDSFYVVVKKEAKAGRPPKETREYPFSASNIIQLAAALTLEKLEIESDSTHLLEAAPDFGSLAPINLPLNKELKRKILSGQTLLPNELDLLFASMGKLAAERSSYKKTGVTPVTVLATGLGELRPDLEPITDLLDAARNRMTTRVSLLTSLFIRGNRNAPDPDADSLFKSTMFGTALSSNYTDIGVGVEEAGKDEDSNDQATIHARIRRESNLNTHDFEVTFKEVYKNLVSYLHRLARNAQIGTDFTGPETATAA
ncbi:MAG TPA: hypothetical protein VD999_03385 [Vitreimonas sp.]|nr:hypothetical protein [Vitreimonas sp.]